MYELIGLRGSRTIRLLIMLEEMGVEYTHIPAMPHSPEAKAVNPSGKVPALRDGDAILTDSVAIMTYLADKHGVLTAPAGTLARARQDAMTLRIVDELDAPLWGEGKQRFFTPAELRSTDVSDFFKRDYANSIARFEDALQGEFLLGSEMSIPDILLTHCLKWAELFEFPAPGPKLAAYKERMEARESFQTALTKD